MRKYWEKIFCKYSFLLCKSRYLHSRRCSHLFYIHIQTLNFFFLMFNISFANYRPNTWCNTFWYFFILVIRKCIIYDFHKNVCNFFTIPLEKKLFAWNHSATYTFVIQHPRGSYVERIVRVEISDKWYEPSGKN